MKDNILQQIILLEQETDEIIKEKQKENQIKINLSEKESEKIIEKYKEDAKILSYNFIKEKEKEIEKEIVQIQEQFKKEQNKIEEKSFKKFSEVVNLVLEYVKKI
ncbi:MAG: hypothetical protein ABIB46_01525 [bacterium]